MEVAPRPDRPTPVKVDLAKDSSLSIRFSTSTHPVSDVAKELMSGLKTPKNTVLENALFTTLITAPEGQVSRLSLRYANARTEVTKDLDVRMQRAKSFSIANPRPIEDQFQLVNAEEWQAREARMPWNEHLENNEVIRGYKVVEVDGKAELVVPLQPNP